MVCNINLAGSTGAGFVKISVNSGADMESHYVRRVLDVKWKL